MNFTNKIVHCDHSSDSSWIELKYRLQKAIANLGFWMDFSLSLSSKCAWKAYSLTIINASKSVDWPNLTPRITRQNSACYHRNKQTSNFIKIVNIALQRKKKKTVLNLAHMQKTLSQFSSVPTLQFWVVKFNSTDLAGCTNPPCNLSKALQKVLRENNVMGRQMYFYYLEWLFVYNQTNVGYLQIQITKMWNWLFIK